MDSVGIPWNSDILVGIQWIPPELMGESKDLTFLGTFTGTWGLFFLGFLHTTSSRCSSFSWDLYVDMGVVFFRFSTHYIIQMLRCFSGHCPGHRGCFFWVFSTGNVPGQRGCFLSGFPGTTSCRCSDLFWDIFPHFPDIYLDMGVVFSGLSGGS